MKRRYQLSWRMSLIKLASSSPAKPWTNARVKVSVVSRGNCQFGVFRQQGGMGAEFEVVGNADRVGHARHHDCTSLLDLLTDIKIPMPIPSVTMAVPP